MSTLTHLGRWGDTVAMEGQMNRFADAVTYLLSTILSWATSALVQVLCLWTEVLVWFGLDLFVPHASNLTHPLGEVMMKQQCQFFFFFFPLAVMLHISSPPHLSVFSSLSSHESQHITITFFSELIFCINTQVFAAHIITGLMHASCSFALS